MRCPIDKSDMIVVEHQNIEMDFCLECRGVWFDSGELELLVEVLKSQGAGLSNLDLINPQSANVREEKRKCPICGHKMHKVWIGSEPKVLIDSCPQGDGLWFDGGELNHILCQLDAGQRGSKNVISFLGETFQAGCQPETGK